LLKDDTGRYGKIALERLSGASDSRIATKAQAALDDKIGQRPFRDYSDDEDGSEKRNTERPNLALLPVVFPKGASLPKSFVDQDFSTASNFGGPSCLQKKIEATSSGTCKVALLDLNKDGQPEVLVRASGYLYLFTLADGKWKGGGMSSYLGANQTDFDTGKLRAVSPVLSDVLIGETRRIGFNNYPQEGDLAVVSEPVSAIKEPVAPSAPPK
jgi:hypothetical protein